MEFANRMQAGRLLATKLEDYANRSDVVVMFGTKPDDHVTHRISNPTTVSLEQTDEGADAALAIKSADSVTALLRFRSAILPEMVDAVAG